MTTVLRAVVAALTLGLVLGVGAVAAASPEPTVGGRLDAVGDTVTVTSQGNTPVSVTMSADVVQLDEAKFSLQPGESRDLTFTGDPVGRIYATFAVQSEATSADANSLTLSVGLKPYTPPFDWTPVLMGLLVLAAFLLLTYRAVRWARRHIRFVGDPDVAA